MSLQVLFNAEKNQLDGIETQLGENLSMLDNDDIPDKVRKAVGKLRASQEVVKLSTFAESKEISHILDFLRLATLQRSRGDEEAGWLEKLITRLFPNVFAPRVFPPDMASQLEQIDRLIISCYQPVADVVKDRLTYKPDEILAIYYQDRYLARPNGPVPYLLIPNFFEGNNPINWIGVGHETGHHVYRQVPGLREEVEVTITKAMRRLSVTVNGSSVPVPDSQQRYWFNCLEEIFADLYGIMMFGAAILHSQQLITHNDSFQKPQTLLKSPDLTHPAPLIRNEIGLYIYEWLLNNSPDPGNSPGNKDLDNLKGNWSEITNRLKDRTIRDPQTPESPSLDDKWNPSGKLGYDETVAVMKLVLDTILKAEFRALDCGQLQNLVNFQDDERKRWEVESQMRKGQRVRFEDIEARIYVAATRLAMY